MGFGGGDLRHILGREVEQLHERNNLVLELRIVQLGRDDLTPRHLAVRRDRKFQHQLALQLRVAARRAIVERVDRTLVTVEYRGDLFRRAGRLAAAARMGGSLAVDTGARDRTRSPKSCRGP